MLLLRRTPNSGHFNYTSDSHEVKEPTQKKPLLLVLEPGRDVEGPKSTCRVHGLSNIDLEEPQSVGLTV